MNSKVVFLSAAALLAIASPSLAAVTVYTTQAAYTAATSGFTTKIEGFEGITTPTSGGIGVVNEGSTFSRGGLTITDTYSGAPNAMNVLDNTYVNGGNQIRNRFGLAAGSVLDAGYGSLTFTFDAPVNAFGIDIATIVRGFVGNSSSSFTLTAGGQSTVYNYSGSFGFGFLGLTSDTALSSVTITSGQVNDDVFDNVRTGVAPAAAVPEPASWALMLVGFGALGATLRRTRQRRVAASVAA